MEELPKKQARERVKSERERAVSEKCHIERVIDYVLNYGVVEVGGYIRS